MKRFQDSTLDRTFNQSPKNFGDSLRNRKRMAAHIRELENATPDQLEEVIREYYIPRVGESTPIDSILQWLSPDSIDFGEDPLTSIKEGLRFSGWTDDLFSLIFDQKIPAASVIISDFAEHPMKEAWGYHPWDLLNGYILAPDRERYFQEITGVPSDKFMNQTERIFYLTRGYGRPNKYVSPADLALRRIYMGASPTALIALSDILGICPTQQDPQVVLEVLSEVDLRTIDKFHQTTVQKITQCLGSSRLCRSGELILTAPLGSDKNPDCLSVFSGSARKDTTQRLTCTKCVTRSVGLKDCNPEVLACFEQFLRSIGALTTIQYDPETNSFISGISQLGLYQDVIPEKRWSYDEVKEMPNIYIRSILRKLPDIELLRASTPYGEQNLKLENSLILRETLLENTYRFLTDKRYFALPNGKICFGRAVDPKLQEMTLDQLRESILEKGALINPYGNPISPEFVEMRFQDPEVKRIISRTRALEFDNQEYLTELSQEQKNKFRDEISRGVPLDEILELNPPEFKRLILWTDQNGRWVPLSMDLDEYLKNWRPLFSEILKQTLKYYIQTL